MKRFEKGKLYFMRSEHDFNDLTVIQIVGGSPEYFKFKTEDGQIGTTRLKENTTDGFEFISPTKKEYYVAKNELTEEFQQYEYMNKCVFA
jgi:hypothetical protein